MKDYFEKKLPPTPLMYMNRSHFIHTSFIHNAVELSTQYINDSQITRWGLLQICQWYKIVCNLKTRLHVYLYILNPSCPIQCICPKRDKVVLFPPLSISQSAILITSFCKVISIKTKNAHSRKELGRFINLTYLYFIKVIQSKERVSARCMMNSHYTFNLSTCVLSIRIKIAHSRTKLAYFIYSTFVNI